MKQRNYRQAKIAGLSEAKFREIVYLFKACAAFASGGTMARAVCAFARDLRPHFARTAPQAPGERLPVLPGWRLAAGRHA